MRWSSKYNNPMSAADDPFRETTTLLQSAKNGDREAMSQLLEKYEKKLLGRIRHLMGPKIREFAQSGDCLQDVFVAVVGEIHRYSVTTEEDFLRWATHIARNRLRYLARRQRIRRMEAFSSRIAAGLGKDGRSPGPATQAGQKDDFVMVTRAMEKLSAEYRQVIELRVMDSLSYDEIAQELGRSRPATVRVLYSRAMARLGRLLMDDE